MERLNEGDSTTFKKKGKENYACGKVREPSESKKGVLGGF